MILVCTTAKAAPATAHALCDDIKIGQRIWISRRIDVRAAKTAAEIAGDKQAIIINLDSFAIGLLVGVVSVAGLWIPMFLGAQNLGEALSQKAGSSEIEMPSPMPDNEP
jgi:hypothetical protein